MWKKGKEHIGPQLPRFPLSFDPLLPAVRPFHTLGSENIGLPKHANNRTPSEPTHCKRGK
jgi:hypothetical protein